MNRTWFEDLCELVAIEAGSRATPKSVERCLYGLYKVMLKQFQLNGKIHIPKFGTFELMQKEARELKVGDPVNGGVKYIYVEPRYYIEFKMSSALDRNINENKFKMKNKKSKTTKESKKDIPPIEATLADMFTKATERQKKNGDRTWYLSQFRKDTETKEEE